MIVVEMIILVMSEYEWDGSTWIQGADWTVLLRISGSHVSLNSDGSIVAMGHLQGMLIQINIMVVLEYTSGMGQIGFN